jgi:two-component sensor histidine kinase
MKAAHHPDEPARISALHTYRILDTPRESDFDDIVQLASQICDAPISVINLIDAERQWFKAEVGLGVRETPLDSSLCAHAILVEDFLMIPDTLLDQRMRDNPLCIADEGIRFYAGALLKNPAGLPLGTLCILDTRPRELTALQEEALRVLARQVTKQLDLRVALHHQDVLRREADHRIKNSLSLVTSLIGLQARAAEADETKAALAVVRTRIGTVAALHEALGTAADGAEVDLDLYLNSIADMLRAALPPNVMLETEIAPCRIAPTRAANLAMILNEWATNALKHAFPGGKPGRVRILGERIGPEYRVTVSDNGVGGTRLARNGGLGMGLIAAAAAQLSATQVQLAQESGTGWAVTFAAV